MNSLQYFEIDVQFLFDKRETIRIDPWDSELKETFIHEIIITKKAQG